MVVKVELKMSKTMKICAAVAAIGLASVGTLSEASAQSVPRRHYQQGYVYRGYPADQYQGSSQYPDYSHTGSGYSREGCSATPAEC
jgi:hypothetical protein